MANTVGTWPAIIMFTAFPPKIDKTAKVACFGATLKSDRCSCGDIELNRQCDTREYHAWDDFSWTPPGTAPARSIQCAPSSLQPSV